MKWFVNNLKKVKRVVVEWVNKKSVEDKEELLKIEEEISNLFYSNSNGIFQMRNSFHSNP
jgi:hypothetical protein